MSTIRWTKKMDQKGLSKYPFSICNTLRMKFDDIVIRIEIWLFDVINMIRILRSTIRYIQNHSLTTVTTVKLKLLKAWPLCIRWKYTIINAIKWYFACSDTFSEILQIQLYGTYVVCYMLHTTVKWKLLKAGHYVLDNNIRITISRNTNIS